MVIQQYQSVTAGAAGVWHQECRRRLVTLSKRTVADDQLAADACASWSCSQCQNNQVVQDAYQGIKLRLPPAKIKYLKGIPPIQRKYAFEINMQ